MNERLKGKLFIISGPSGVGKGTAIHLIKKDFPEFVYPISHTTRIKRPQERDGEVYHFISVEEFRRAIEHGEFLEWAQVHQSNYYGTLKKPIMDALKEGKFIIREVDVQGFESIRKVIPPENLVTIFLKAESLDSLLTRIAKRGQLPEEELKKRMESAQRELQSAHLFDYEVWSLEGKIDQCVEEVEQIIKRETEKAAVKI